MAAAHERIIHCMSATLRNDVTLCDMDCVIIDAVHASGIFMFAFSFNVQRRLNGDKSNTGTTCKQL